MLCFSALLLTGCGTAKTSPVGRAASDQYLVSRSIEDAMGRLNIASDVRGKTVKLSVQAITTDESNRRDVEYVNTAAREWLHRCGATEPAADAKPDLDLKVMVQSVGSDLWEGGIKLPMPVPSLDTVVTLTELWILVNSSQVARCHLRAWGLNPEGDVVVDAPPVFVSHYLTKREILGFSLGTWSDLPELKKKKSKKVKE